MRTMLCGVLALSAPAFPRAASADAPRAELAVTDSLLAGIDQAYLNRHLGNNLENSNSALLRLREAQPRNPALLWRLGRGLHAKGRARLDPREKLQAFKEGETALAASITARPGDAEAHYWLARIAAAQNEILRTLHLTKVMRAELETALRLNANHGGAHHLLGELLRQLPGSFGGDKRKAVAELEEAVRLEPDDSSHYPALAEAYLAVADKPRAVTTARKAFAITTPADPGGFESDLKDARDLLRRLGAPETESSSPG